MRSNSPNKDIFNNSTYLREKTESIFLNLRLKLQNYTENILDTNNNTNKKFLDEFLKDFDKCDKELKEIKKRYTILLKEYLEVKDNDEYSKQEIIINGMKWINDLKIWETNVNSLSSRIPTITKDNQSINNNDSNSDYSYLNYSNDNIDESIVYVRKFIILGRR